MILPYAYVALITLFIDERSALRKPVTIEHSIHFDLNTQSGST